MSKEFKRETRYLVLKLSEIQKYMSLEDRKTLFDLVNRHVKAKEILGIKPLECVCVESDWSCYEEVWHLVKEESLKHHEQQQNS